jgi:hypothetical protein
MKTLSQVIVYDLKVQTHRQLCVHSDLISRYFQTKLCNYFLPPYVFCVSLKERIPDISNKYEGVGELSCQ